MFAATAEVAVARHPDVLEPVSVDDARAMYPPLGPIRHALFNPRGARVDGRSMVAALEFAARARSGLAERDRAARGGRRDWSRSRARPRRSAVARRDRGRRVDHRRRGGVRDAQRRASRAGSDRPPPPRCGHRVVAGVAADPQPLRGAVPRRAPRARRDRRGRGLRRAAHRGRPPPAVLGGPPAQSRPRRRDLPRGARRAAAGQRRRPPGDRQPPRRRHVYVASGHGANGLLLGPVTGASWPTWSAGARRRSTSPTSRPPGSPEPAAADLDRLAKR